MDLSIIAEVDLSPSLVSVIRALERDKKTDRAKGERETESVENASPVVCSLALVSL